MHSENDDKVFVLQRQVQHLPPRVGMLLGFLLAGFGGLVGIFLFSWNATSMDVCVKRAVEGSNATRMPGSTAITIERLEQPKSLPAEANGRLVIQAHDATYLVLEQTPDAGWGTGAIATKSDKNQFRAVTRQPVAADQMPSHLTWWQDRDMLLYDEQGYVCTAKVGQMVLLAQSAHEYDDLERAITTWEDSVYPPLLAARLETLRGSCKKARWARDATLPPPSLARVRQAGKKLRKQAKSAFVQSAAYQNHQAQFLQEGGHEDWFDESGQELVVQFVKSAEEQLVFVGTQMVDCGSLGADMGLVFRRERDGRLTPIVQSEGLMLQIDAAADMDADGDLDLVTTGDAFDTSLFLQTGDGLLEESSSSVSIHYCRC